MNYILIIIANEGHTAVIPISQCGLIHVLLVLHKNKNEPEQVNSKIR